MPNRDGTGPRGQGMGRGRGPGRGGGGMGRLGGGGAGRSFANTTGNCVCPQCGHKSEHRIGFPCNREICPECGTKMILE